MKFKLEIECNNAAFEDDAGEEVKRILLELVGKLESGRIESFMLRDINGNLVGTAEFKL